MAGTLERPRVIEGAWEDVVRQAGDLAGRRVTLTVHPEGSETAEARQDSTEPRNLLEFLGDFVGVAHSGGEERLSEDTGERFTDELARKRAEGRL